MAIKVNGQKYKVLENLGYVHERDQYAKVVYDRDNDCERIVVRNPYRGAPWEFSTPKIVVMSGQRPKGQ